MTTAQQPPDGTADGQDDPRDGGEPRRYIVRLPPALERSLITAQPLAEAALGSGDTEGAYMAFDAVYRAMLAAQPKGRRFHKGLPLNQMAIFRLIEGRLREAASLFMDAFIEDSLSRGEEMPQQLDELNGPAARNLVVVIGFGMTDILQWATEIRRLQQVSGLVNRPSRARAMLALNAVLDGIPEQVTPPPTGPIRRFDGRLPPGYGRAAPSPAAATGVPADEGRPTGLDETATEEPGTREPADGQAPVSGETEGSMAGPEEGTTGTNVGSATGLAGAAIAVDVAVPVPVIEERIVRIPMLSMTEEELRLLVDLMSGAAAGATQFALRAHVIVPDGELQSRMYVGKTLDDVLKETPRDRIRSLDLETTAAYGTRATMSLHFETNERSLIHVQGPRDEMVLLKERIKDFIDLQTGSRPVQALAWRPSAFVVAGAMAALVAWAVILLLDRLGVADWHPWLPYAAAGTALIVAVLADRLHIAGHLVPRVHVPGWGRFGWLRTLLRAVVIAVGTAIAYVVVELVISHVPTPPVK